MPFSINVPPQGDDLRRSGVPFNMFKVEAYDLPQKAVKVGKGSYWLQSQKKYVEYSGGTFSFASIPWPPLNYGKWFLLCINGSGVITLLQGVELPNNPLLPDPSADVLPLAAIFVEGSDTVITNDMIFDLKPIWTAGTYPTVHSTLTNRDALDAHPIASITGLQGELDNRYTITDVDAALQAKADINGTPSEMFMLNNDETGVPATTVSIGVKRGNLDDVFIRYNEQDDQWEFTNDGTTYHAFVTSSSFNPLLYYTKTELETPGQAEIPWENIVDVPELSLKRERVVFVDSQAGPGGDGITIPFAQLDDAFSWIDADVALRRTAGGPGNGDDEISYVVKVSPGLYNTAFTVNADDNRCAKYIRVEMAGAIVQSVVNVKFSAVGSVGPAKVEFVGGDASGTDTANAGVIIGTVNIQGDSSVSVPTVNEHVVFKGIKVHGDIVNQHGGTTHLHFINSTFSDATKTVITQGGVIKLYTSDLTKILGSIGGVSNNVLALTDCRDTYFAKGFTIQPYAGYDSRVQDCTFGGGGANTFTIVGTHSLLIDNGSWNALNKTSGNTYTGSSTTVSLWEGFHTGTKKGSSNQLWSGALANPIIRLGSAEWDGDPVTPGNIASTEGVKVYGPSVTSQGASFNTLEYGYGQVTPNQIKLASKDSAGSLIEITSLEDFGLKLRNNSGVETFAFDRLTGDADITGDVGVGGNLDVTGDLTVTGSISSTGITPIKLNVLPGFTFASGPPTFASYSSTSQFSGSENLPDAFVFFDEFGYVVFGGAIYNSVGTAGPGVVTLGTLPATYHPSTNVIAGQGPTVFSCPVGLATGATFGTCAVYISPVGVMKAIFTASFTVGLGVISLNGIRYRPYA